MCIMTTLVSCYYKTKINKHSHDNYDHWIRMLVMGLNKVNMVIYTQETDKEYLTSIFEENKSIQYKIIVRELNELEIVKKYPDIWENQERIDPQQHISRRKECYIIWNSKFNFLKETIDMNPFDSEYFIWNDIGNVRDLNTARFLQGYPNKNKISRDKLDIILLKQFERKQDVFYTNEVHFSGSMFGGHKETLTTLHEKYYSIFDYYVNSNKFIGCDQQLISTMYILNTSLFNTILPKMGLIDVWFYLYYYYNN